MNKEKAEIKFSRPEAQRFDKWENISIREYMDIQLNIDDRLLDLEERFEKRIRDLENLLEKHIKKPLKADNRMNFIEAVKAALDGKGIKDLYFFRPQHLYALLNKEQARFIVNDILADDWEIVEAGQ